MSIKWLVIVFNFLFGIAGGLLIVYGIHGMSHFNVVFDSVDGLFLLPVFLIFCGSILLLLCALAFFGGIFEVREIIKLYGILLLLFLAFQIAITVAGFLSKDKYHDYLLSMSHLNLKASDASNTYWHRVHKALKCCGVIGAGDFASAGKPDVPGSCCPGAPDKCDTGSAFPQGCFTKLMEMVSADYTMGILVAMLAIQVIGVVFAWSLASTFKARDWGAWGRGRGQGRGRANTVVTLS